jgi:hypothetical protein
MESETLEEPEADEKFSYKTSSHLNRTVISNP